MNTDGGEPLDYILRRKDLERRSGEGEFENTFWWGVGESKGQAIWTWLVESGDDKPPILFSEALGEAKPEDKRPKSCLLWRTYQTRDANGRYSAEHPAITPSYAMPGTSWRCLVLWSSTRPKCET